MIKRLLNKKMKFLKNQQGLTLIELLVVIVILGIIAAIAIPAVMSNRTDAAKNTNAQNVSIIQDAVERYKAVNGAVPTSTTVAEFKTLLTGNTAGGPYIDTWPKVSKFTGCTDTDFGYSASTGKVSLSASCLPPVAS